MAMRLSSSVVGIAPAVAAAFDRRVTTAFLAAARLLRVTAAFFPAARCLRVFAAFLPAARDFRQVFAAFFAADFDLAMFSPQSAQYVRPVRPCTCLPDERHHVGEHVAGLRQVRRVAGVAVASK